MQIGVRESRLSKGKERLRRYMSSAMAYLLMPSDNFSTSSCILRMSESHVWQPDGE